MRRDRFVEYWAGNESETVPYLCRKEEVLHLRRQGIGAGRVGAQPNRARHDCCELLVGNN